MAEAFARQLGRGRVEAFSAGSKPRGSVDATAISVMGERGISMASHTSKGLDALPAGRWDVLVTMGCGDACPTLPAARRIDWQIPDPARQPVDIYRGVRDTIEASIRTLLDELDAGTTIPLE